jgi:hypothetical protein
VGERGVEGSFYASGVACARGGEEGGDGGCEMGMDHDSRGRPMVAGVPALSERFYGGPSGEDMVPGVPALSERFYGSGVQVGVQWRGSPIRRLKKMTWIGSEARGLHGFNIY